MYSLRQFIQNIGDNRRINKDVYIKSSIVYVNNGEYEYKYQNNTWYIKVGDAWIDLQGGTPNYYIEENLDADIFMEVNNE